MCPCTEKMYPDSILASNNFVIDNLATTPNLYGGLLYIVDLATQRFRPPITFLYATYLKS